MVCSLALARLRTDIKGDLTGNNAVGMAQKLLLFWRKPARRCWWEGVELEDVEGVEGILKVWIRRVWTLEMVRDSSTPRLNLLTIPHRVSLDYDDYNTALSYNAMSKREHGTALHDCILEYLIVVDICTQKIMVSALYTGLFAHTTPNSYMKLVHYVWAIDTSSCKAS